MSDVATTIRDPERIAALRRLLLLDTGPAESFDRLAGLAARTVRAPIGLITLVDHDRQYFKGAYGLPEPLASTRETPLEFSICQYAVSFGAPLVICDAALEHWLDDNPAVRDFGVRAYAGVPLVTSEGYSVGTLCALDLTPRMWSDDDMAMLDDLGAVTMREIRLHWLERRLAHQRP